MTKRGALLVGAIALVIVSLMAIWFWPRPPQPVAQTQPPAPAHPPAPTSLTPPPPALVPDPGGPLSIKTMSREEATKIYVQRFNQDHHYDWKVPLNFYGKVIDENNQPVAGATAHMQWNTLDAPSGTSYGQTLSDGGGLFSLTGQRGKILEVRVEKEGYYTVDGGAGSLAFEYANPSSPNYNEPDPNNPVIFHLRSKGAGAKLFSKTLNVPLTTNHPQDRVNLMQGFIKPDGVLTITTDKSKFLPGNQPFPWTMSLSMSEGGLVETDDQFPFMAPASGYTSTINLDMTNTDPSVWQDGVKKTYYFYLPSTNTYGRITVTTVSSLPFVTLNYAYNLAPGNRVLEPASR
ncbi:MAG: carboxypeptidase-like regulatory domain-containing protein [Methylacidiphilales bacterium]|nr:carboxypeptidase-like regulatory domain-containing protein [Candidatus Methylacidiphilales bacterium]